MTPVTGNCAHLERTAPAEFFGYPPASCHAARPVARRCDITPAPADPVVRTPQELALQARMFLDGA